MCVNETFPSIMLKKRPKQPVPLGSNGIRNTLHGTLGSKFSNPIFYPFNMGKCSFVEKLLSSGCWIGAAGTRGWFLMMPDPKMK